MPDEDTPSRTDVPPSVADAPSGVPIGLPAVVPAVVVPASVVPVPVPVSPDLVVPVGRSDQLAYLRHVLLAVAAWVLIYLTGIVVSAAPYVRAVNGGISWWVIPWYALVIVLSHSLSNIAILCCLSTVIGGACSPKHNEAPQVLIAKGLFVYLTMIAGVLVVETTPFENVTQSSYVRIASVAASIPYASSPQK